MILRLLRRALGVCSPSEEVPRRAQAAFRAGWLEGEADLAAEEARLGRPLTQEDHFDRLLRFPLEHPEAWAMVERSAQAARMFDIEDDEGEQA